MQSGTRIQGVISHNSYTNPSLVSHPSTHNQNLGPSSTTDPRDHNDTKYGSTPEQSAPVLGHRGYLATTSIEATTNILRSEILRNLNDNNVLKNPLELNSPETQSRYEAPRQNSVTSASYRFQKYPRDPKNIF